MENVSYLSLQELMEEYYAKLKSSKEQDPKKNLLFQEIIRQLGVMVEGTASVDHYEIYLPSNFIPFWKEFHYHTWLEEYKEQLRTRMESSSDAKRLLELEIKMLDRHDLFDRSLTGDPRKDGEKLGHLLAVNGENPTISALIHNLTSYDFGIFPPAAATKVELLDEKYWKQLQKSYGEIFHKLNWVCRGYLEAQKISYLQQVQQSLVQMADTIGIENDTASPKLTLKQQVLLAHNLGFLDSEPVKSLTLQNQGKLLARLFGKNEKNTEDLIRHRHGKNVEKKYSLLGTEVTDAVNALLSEVKIKL